MKNLISNINNTYRTFKLLSNPRVGELLKAELQKEIAKSQIEPATEKTFHHGHYFVQVIG